MPASAMQCATAGVSALVLPVPTLARTRTAPYFAAAHARISVRRARGSSRSLQCPSPGRASALAGLWSAASACNSRRKLTWASLGGHGSHAR